MPAPDYQTLSDMSSCMSVSLCPRSTAISRETAVDVTLYDTIAAVPAADWHRFTEHSGPLLQPDYLLLLERTLQSEMEFIYALVRKDQALIGVAYFQVVRFKGTNLTAYFPQDNEGLKNKLINLTKGLVAKIDVPLLVSGNLFITGEQGISFLPQYTVQERSYFLAHTIDHILAQRRHIKAVLMPDMYEPVGDFDEAFLRYHYKRIYVEADMSMRLPQEWHSFDDYLGAITSKYRVRARKILQTSHQLTSRELTADELQENIEKVYQLYRNVADKADFNIARLPKDYYPAQLRQSPDMYKVFGYFLEGRMVGFMTLFILPYKTEVHYCGIDYSINKEHNLYQRMLYDVVKYATEHDLRLLHFGRTAPEVKSTIGAIPQPMYGYLRHRNPLVNALMGLFTGRLKPRHYILRSPFK